MNIQTQAQNELTPWNLKCLEFVEHYMMCFNASQAARQMGYKGCSASSQGWEFLHHDFTQAELRRRYEKHAEDNKTIRQEIIMMLHREANYFGPGSSAGARVKAQTQLSKIFGMETLHLKAEVGVSGGIMVVPMASSIDDWEKIASRSQEKLMESTISIQVTVQG